MSNSRPFRARAPLSSLAYLALALLAACDDDPGAPPVAARLDSIVALTQSAVVGSVVAGPVVRVVSADGEPVSGVTVNFTIEGGGTLTFTSMTTQFDGLANAGVWTLGTRAGEQTVRAEAAGLEPIVFRATARPGGPTSIIPTAGMNQTAPAGSLLPVAPAVTLRDTHGNPVANLTIAFAIQSGGGTVIGGIATTNENGVASAGGWQLGPTPGTQRVLALAGPLTVTFEATATP